MGGRIRLVVCVAAATLTLGVAAAHAAQETPVTCDQVVTGTVKLANDLVCPDTDGLIVGSDNTVIDLNGHRIACEGSGYLGSCQGIAPTGAAPDQDPENGVDIDERRNVHVFTSVPGATIEGFDNGVNIQSSDNVKVEHLVLTGPPRPGPVNPRPPSHGVLVRGATCGGGNIHIGTGQKSGNDASNHNQGIAVNGDCVSVVHNRAHDNNSTAAVIFGFPFIPNSNGILLSNAADNVVRGNEVERNGDGDLTPTGPDAGIQIRREDSTDNLVTNNIVNANMGDGISLRLGANSNHIVDNTMLLNGGRPELYDAAGRGAPGGPPGSDPLNEWNRNNRCLTENGEVPLGTCEPDDVPPGEG